MTDNYHQCRHCGELAPVANMTALAWAGVSRSLSNGQPSLAAAELSSLGIVTQAQSIDCVRHLRACVFSWPLEPSLQPIMTSIDAAFLGVPRPDHFTNFEHCDECRQHDETLRARTVKTLTRRDLGNLGYSPISFCQPPGFAYCFPAIARFAAIPALSEDQDSIADMLGANLSSRVLADAFLDHCTPPQREAVAALLDWLGETNASTHYLRGLTSWTEGAQIWRTARP